MTPLSRGRFGSSDADIFHRYMNNSSFIFHFQDSGLSFPAPCLNSGCKSRRRPQKGKPGQIHRPLLARRGSVTGPAPSTILIVLAITDIPSFSKLSRPAGIKVLGYFYLPLKEGSGFHWTPDVSRDPLTDLLAFWYQEPLGDPYVVLTRSMLCLDGGPKGPGPCVQDSSAGQP